MKSSESQIETANTHQQYTEPFFQPNKKVANSFFDNGTTFTPTIQTKLSIGQVGDKYEKEADTMADHVVQNSKNMPPTVQTKCAACNTEEAQMKPAIQKMDGEDEEVQMKPNIQKMETHGQYEEMEKLQTKADSNRSEASPELESQLNHSRGGGSALPSNSLNEMNQAFGADFSNVKVHTGTNAIQMNQQLGSQAFTNGNNIFFNQGKYNPESSQGKHLLAHELTHTIHQGAVEKES